jgi:hypothetical protein
MASRDKQVEYIDVNTSRGVIHTMDIRLYAPDGSIFRMPHGGDPLLYIGRGYLSKPSPAWQELNDEYEKNKAVSLKRSDFQREVKNREKALEAKKELLRFDELMKSQDAEMERVEAELAIREKALLEPEAVEVAPVVEAVVSPEPVKKKSPGRPKKSEA